MNIDWFTFGAQIVNFLILVALLRWLLYDRILEAMQAREDRIAEQLADAERKQQAADAERNQYQEQLAVAEQQREETLRGAHQEAEQERDRLIREARDEVQQLQRRWREEYQRERDGFLAEVRHDVGRAAVEIAQQVLRKLADTKLERKLADQFIRSLEDMPESQYHTIARHLVDASEDVVVRSAFPLHDADRQQLESTMGRLFDVPGTLQYQVDPALFCGLELDAGGYCFGWNITQFLDEMHFAFDQQLDRPAS
jgi:F-type H+-transporting ATPase subunit b